MRRLSMMCRVDPGRCFSVLGVRNGRSRRSRPDQGHRHRDVVQPRVDDGEDHAGLEYAPAASCISFSIASIR